MSIRAVKHLSADPVMSALIQRVGPIKIKPRRHPPFHSLCQAIVYQQLSGKAAGTIFGRFQALFEGTAFPTPAQILAQSPERLRSVGLSRPKTSYILDLATRCHAGLVPSLEDCDALTDAEIIERVTEIKGIGRWTAEMLLIFNLGRPDVLPIHDLGVRRGFQVAYKKRKLPEPERLEAFGVRWAPHRTVAAQYLWAAADAKTV